MAELVGSIFVDMALESASFISGLKRAGAATEQMGSTIQGAMRLAGGAIAGLVSALSVDAFVGATRRAFDFADAIVDLSDRTGASTKFIQEFGYAAQLSGSSVESSHAALEKFTKKLGEAEAGSKSASDELLALGVKSYDVDEAVRQAADGISKLDSTSKQAAATTSLFGKKAMDLTALMSGGADGMNKLAQQADALGIVLEDGLLRNAGKVNDQLDTMKMIMDAKFANMIIQNADAISSLADAFMKAAGAAADFFASMRSARNMNIIKYDSLSNKAMAWMHGETRDEQVKGAIKDQWSTHKGRADLYRGYAEEHNRQLAAGNTAAAAVLRKKAEQVRAADQLAALRGELANGHAPRTSRTLSAIPGKSKTPHAATPPHLKTDAELADAWNKELERAQKDELQARIGITNNVEQRGELERQLLDTEYQARIREIALETGSDQEVREGRKRYTVAQGEQLKALEEQAQTERLELSYNQESEELARQKLSVQQAALGTEADLLNGSADLARSSKERREIALRLVDLQYQQEKLALEAIRASATATDAEKAIAKARLDALPTLRKQAEDRANRDNKGPLDTYLDAIPKTADEINDALGKVEVDGLESLKSGLMDCIKGTGDLGDAFKNMTGRIIDGLLEIAIQQAIIKPLGGLLFGGGSSPSGGGSGGLFGSIFGDILKQSVKGGKANGGMGNGGRWLVGEHGPEIVDMGGPFNVVPHSKLAGVAGGAGGVNVTFGSITSNDPEAIQAIAVKTIHQMAPMLTQNAKNYTKASFSRPVM